MVDLVKSLARWARDKEWVVVAQLLGVLVIVVPEVVRQIDSGDFDLNRPEGWAFLVIAIVTFVIRQNVWSKASVEELTSEG